MADEISFAIDGVEITPLEWARQAPPAVIAAALTKLTTALHETTVERDALREENERLKAEVFSLQHSDEYMAGGAAMMPLVQHVEAERDTARREHDVAAKLARDAVDELARHSTMLEAARRELDETREALRETIDRAEDGVMDSPEWRDFFAEQRKRGGLE